MLAYEPMNERMHDKVREGKREREGKGKGQGEQRIILSIWSNEISACHVLNETALRGTSILSFYQSMYV